jgi:pimeloyl-ACP methyl ester carboxylesterase
MVAVSEQRSEHIGIGGTVDRYWWNWQGKQYQIVYESLGQGSPVLLLPAFSTVSTRAEMRKIAQLLSSQYQVFALDWLGFGQSDRPLLDYQPDLYRQLLQDFVRDTFNNPITVIAAGHAAGYGLELAKQQPAAVTKLILVAPTWRGPLRAMGLPKGVRNSVREMVRSPILGQALYFLNTTPSFLRLMYKRHVYVDESKLTPEFIAQKHQITQAQGSRYAPAAFVTGTIDPVETRSQWLAYFESLALPILVIIAENAPPSSKAEMEAMAQLPTVREVKLKGTLGIHEEYPEAVTEASANFLNSH